MLVAENLHMRLRPRITKRFERRQGENEIADRTAADYQNAVHACAGAHERRNPIQANGSHGSRLQLILCKRESKKHAAINQLDRV